MRWRRKLTLIQKKTDTVSDKEGRLTGTVPDINIIENDTVSGKINIIDTTVDLNYRIGWKDRKQNSKDTLTPIQKELIHWLHIWLAITTNTATIILS